MPRVPAHTLDDAPEQTRPTLESLQSAHTLGGKAAGLDPDTMIAIRAGRTTGDDRLDTLLAVVREAATDVGTVQDATWKQAQAAGWTDEQLTEAFAHLAANLFTNDFNHYVGTELDVPPAPNPDRAHLIGSTADRTGVGETWTSRSTTSS